MRPLSLPAVVLFLFFFIHSSFSEISVRVFSKESALHESNVSKPSLYIENIGSSAISDFYCHYYVTAENGKVPQIDDYYTPQSAVSIAPAGDRYIVTYDFTGTTLAPQEITPNTNGNNIGIRFSDWSAYDKTNDLSCNLSPAFTLNGNIAVYLSDGTQIYGNELPDPANPPQPPVVFNALGSYAVYSSEFTDIRDNAGIQGGNIGSAVYTEVGCDATVSGDVLSGANIFLRERAQLSGDVTAGEYIHKQNNVVTVTERQHARIDFAEIKRKTISTAGVQDIIVPNNQTCELTPGDYRDFHAYANAFIYIQPGQYTFRNFIIEPDVDVTLGVTNSDAVEFTVSGEIQFGERMAMTFESGTAYPLSFRVYSAQENLLRIGTDSQVYGIFTAPDAQIHVYSRTDVYGAIYGRRAVVEPQATICKPPVLSGFTHSKWALAPPFDPLVFEYVAVVPDATATIHLSPYTYAGNTVTVNGNSPEDAVELAGEQTHVSIQLNSPDACGTTAYDLDITKSADYRIFVNDDSPCVAGTEDGASWETAFKDLQPAIELAEAEGKEIWLAEGVYTPARERSSGEPRSKTFVLRSGVELIGGFKGDETERKPEGSPYNTILSGDIDGNDSDTDFDQIPFTADAALRRADNAYHVVTIEGFPHTAGARLQNILITGGAADGQNDNSFGGALYCKYAYPVIENCVFTRNYSMSNGGAVYCGSGLADWTKALFDNNVSLEGCGGGLYIRDGEKLNLNQVVFRGNHTTGQSATAHGAALYALHSQVNFTNSLLYGNRSSGAGNAIYGHESTINMLNCTLAKNGNGDSTECVSLHESTASFTNNIHWDNGLEIQGNQATVSHTLIEEGFGGTGNLDDDPQFADINDPLGADGIWGSDDDGLRLGDASPAIGTSCDSFPETDIAETYRQANADGKSDLGAYAWVPEPPAGTNAVLGYFDRTGEFVEPHTIHAYPMFDSEWGYILARNSNRVLYARLLVKNKKQTRDISGGPVTISALDTAGTAIYSKVIRAKRAENGEKINGKLVFYSKYPIMFLQDRDVVDYYSQTKPNDSLFFMYGNAEETARFKITAYTDDYR